jgi:cell division protein FtsI (penicillin-binding protein 3)
MHNFLFRKKKNQRVYIAGEEINLDFSKKLLKNRNKDANSEIYQNRVMFVILGFFIIFSIITIRLFDVSLSGDYIKRIDTKNNTSPHMLFSGVNKRADITDRNGIILATSLPTVNLYANSYKIKNPEKTAKKLSKILKDIKYKTILKRLKRKTSFIYLKRNITPNQQYEINYLGIPGLEFENGEKRIYPQSNLFAHIIGMTNIDNEGIAGLEKSLNKRLIESTIPIKLTIDAGIQDTIREKLKNAVEEFSALGATAILMDVKNSEIISLVSLPDFDPNNYTKNDKYANFNTATKGVYELGSVFKVFNTAMALDSGKIKADDSFDATKPLKLYNRTIKDFSPQKRFLNVPEILIHSSNIGSAQIALKIGKEIQKKFFKKIGFLKKVNIELPEIAEPIKPKKWTDLTAATISYGYGIAVTPLHLITAFSGIMNDGLFHNAKLIKNSHFESGKRIISEESSKTLRDMLRLVVLDGSAKKANIKRYEVGGKTGTAEKLGSKGRYINRKVRTTFISAFPIHNPKYALLVMIDEPKPTKKTWGFVTSGWNAVPTGSNIIKTIAPQLKIEPNYDEEIEENDAILRALYEYE